MEADAAGRVKPEGPLKNEKGAGFRPVTGRDEVSENGRLDFLVPINERHLRKIVKEWGRHDKRGRPHSSLGPGVPERPSRESVPASSQRHTLRAGWQVGKTSVFGGLDHEYRLGMEAA